MNEKQSPDVFRYEVKYVARTSELHRLLAWIKTAAAGYSEPFPSRQINNVYFDTFDYFAYAENLSGASSRSKVRFRWYGAVDRPDEGTLEIKRRRSGVGWKLSYGVGPVPVGDVASWRVFRNALRQQLPPEACMWLDANPQQILINRYQRRYFVSRDGRIRLTVDWNQRVYDQRFRHAPNLVRAANTPDTLVVELKFDRSDRRLANQYAQGIPIRLSRNSKYVIGVQAINYD